MPLWSPQRLPVRVWLPPPLKSVASPWPRVPAASLGTRPAYRISGLIDADDALKPSAMSPAPSIAALPIQRQVESGWYVPCWAKVGVPEVALLISHQRMPDTPPDATVRLPTSASCPSSKRRYAERDIGR